MSHSSTSNSPASNSPTIAPADQPPIYQGQFGPFTITPNDRRGVWIYRGALNVAALTFAAATLIVMLGKATYTQLQYISLCYGLLWLSLGVALWTIHIYLIPLHRLLQLFWMIGGIAALTIVLSQPDPLALYVYQHPFAVIGIGFTFAALTGIFFKEAFCFDRLETKGLTPIVPILVLGHCVGLLPTVLEQGLVITWAILFMIFGLRKLFQPIPADIGDKSVFEYLKTQR